MTDKTVTASFNATDDRDVLLTLLVRKGERVAEVVGAEVLDGPGEDVLSVFALRHANDGMPRVVTLIARPGHREPHVVHVGVLAD